VKSIAKDVFSITAMCDHRRSSRPMLKLHERCSVQSPLWQQVNISDWTASLKNLQQLFLSYMRRQFADENGHDGT